MPEAFASAIIPADAAAVWAVVRDFDGLPRWHPAIASSELETPGDSVGAVRRLTLGDGGQVRELLASLDDTARSLTYEILTSPFPVRLYRSTMRVVPVTTTGESFVEWGVVFDCDSGDAEQLTELFGQGVFAGGLTGLGAHFSPSVE
ncbi:SRPBCC family protein [Actinomycetospora sp.]|jgi:hypothetical protein|uniref:SRPBCC family protein n=1 Tax=Actinomycetospora sp. TaxID=1872135 RepID=UPI002F3F3016